jgi:uncharacterized protein
MKRQYLFLTFFALVQINILFAADKRALIFTRNGEGYVHDNIKASAEAVTKLCREHNIIAEVTDSPDAFTKENLFRFSVIIFSNTNNQVFDNNDQRLALMQYIQAGGGFVGIHSACATERGWPWFWAMVGGFFVRHPQFQPFDIKIIDATHPSTRSLPAVWRWEDECYYLDHLNPDIHILMAADLRTIQDDKMSEYPGKTFGDYFPLAWTHQFDGGREFYTAIGHKIEHYSDPQFLQHLWGGIQWAMGDGVKLDPHKIRVTTVELVEPPKQ